MDTKDDDWIEHLFVASTHDYVLFFTSRRQGLPAQGARAARGQPPGRAAAPSSTCCRCARASACARCSRRATSPRACTWCSATRRGVVKKTLFKEYDTPRKADGIIAINIREGDELIGVRLTSRRRRRPADLAQRPGGALLREATCAPMGRATGRRDRHEAAQGRRGHRDRRAPTRRRDLLVVTENGYGKRTRVAEYPRKGRGTMGVLTIRLVEARGAIVGALVVGPRQEHHGHHRVRHRAAHGGRRASRRWAAPRRA